MVGEIERIKMRIKRMKMKMKMMKMKMKKIGKKSINSIKKLISMCHQKFPKTLFGTISWTVSKQFGLKK